MERRCTFLRGRFPAGWRFGLAKAFGAQTKRLDLAAAHDDVAEVSVYRVAAAVERLRLGLLPLGQMPCPVLIGRIKRVELAQHFGADHRRDEILA